MSDLAGRRRAGLLIPLFSCPSTSSWGIGDIGDVVPMTRWMAGARLRVLQLLPLNEMAPGQASPYSAITAMAIDPIFITVPDVPEFERLGGEASLDSQDRAVLAAVRGSPSIEYARVRALKQHVLRSCFQVFIQDEWKQKTARAHALTTFVNEQAWWVENYALFRAIHAAHGEAPWTDWPEGLRQRDPTAVAAARRDLAEEILFTKYLQWTADAQWRRARGKANGVALFGDLPFMVDGDSADVWARQDEFSLEDSVGVPPDAFSAAGQDWGMPLYIWDAIAGDDYRWLRERARRSADLYDGFRVDHLVGFYRTYARPRNGGEPFFSPADEREQTALGERVLGILTDAGIEIVAEDLGTVPDFVRASLERQGIPGFKVLRWERHWHAEGKPFRDPCEYPALSVANSGTHDTETMSSWWTHASDDERTKISQMPSIQRLTAARGIGREPFVPRVRDVLLEALYSSGSKLLLMPIQDVFGWDDRINEPATISGRNWTYRLPWPSDRLDESSEARERQETLRRWAEEYGR